MSPSSAGKPVVVGVEPWLPWPLRAWPWWTRSIPAERLAILRIGLTVCLLIDLWLNYLPRLDDFFGKGRLGVELFGYYGEGSRWNWSILRGFGNPLLSEIALLAWVFATVWVGLDFVARLTGDKNHPPSCSGWKAILTWNLAVGVIVLGTWARSIADGGESRANWATPLCMFSLALGMVVVEFWRLWFRDAESEGWSRLWWLLGSFALCAVLTFEGKFLSFDKWAAEQPPYSIGRRLLESWQEDPILLRIAFWSWFGGVVALLLGIGTRGVAIFVWTMSVSFAHANPNVDNAGDTIRSIILFYLMLCPCGAAWSIDAWLRRRRTGDYRPVHVSPWPLRLLFVQMTLVYFMNGLYKLAGDTWFDGDSLYLVLGDVTLNRFPLDYLPMPLFVMRIMTWTVLVWEFGFPLWVALPWTRPFALVFGVLFHLGIFMTMELGGFGPYMLTLYLPLLPLRAWRTASSEAAEVVTEEETVSLE